MFYRATVATATAFDLMAQVEGKTDRQGNRLSTRFQRANNGAVTFEIHVFPFTCDTALLVDRNTIVTYRLRDEIDLQAILQQHGFAAVSE